MTREQYMDAIDQIMQDTLEFDLIEEILTKHGASDDDSDSDEGYFVTMSDNYIIYLKNLDTDTYLYDNIEGYEEYSSDDEDWDDWD